MRYWVKAAPCRPGARCPLHPRYERQAANATGRPDGRAARPVLGPWIDPGGGSCTSVWPHGSDGLREPHARVGVAAVAVRVLVQVLLVVILGVVVRRGRR